MAQPFLKGSEYHSEGWSDLQVTLHERHLSIRSGKPCLTLSSAVWGGGFREHDAFTNWSVPLSFDCVDPEQDLSRWLAECGYHPQRTTGMLTAADLRRASLHEAWEDEFGLLCCVTAGTGNAVRTGTARPTFSSYRADTINIVLLVAGSMTPAAMTNAVITITEAKTAALHDLNIRDEWDRPATGTSTDSVLVAVRPGGIGGTHRYAGAATQIGNAIGRLVYASVLESAGSEGREA